MAAVVLSIVCGFAGPWVGDARAEATGPDGWAVKGVKPNDVLNMHRDGNARSPIVGTIPHDARGLKSLGCAGGPTFAQWMAMNEAQRLDAARKRWCRISYQGKRGWVAGRFLAEDGGTAVPARIGPWQLKCDASWCGIEQTGIGVRRPAALRIEGRHGENAAITILRPGLPNSGTLSIYMDGKLITAGPIGPLRSKDGQRIVMPADDITLGLIRQMATHQNMVVALPDEPRGIEFHLEAFEDARKALKPR